MRLMRVAPMESAYGWYSIAQRRVEQCLPLSVGQRSDATSPHQSSPGHELSHVSTSSRLHRTAAPIFKYFGPVRNNRHLRTLATLNWTDFAT